MAFQINGSSLADPTSYQPDGIAENGTFTDGAPLLQGLEAGTLMWRAMEQDDYADLYDAWNSNKGNLVSGTLPPRSGSSLGSYDSVTAYYHEPMGRPEFGVVNDVRMRVTFVAR